MSKKDTLYRRIDTFLSKKSASNGGYAPVTAQDVSQLQDIVQRLLELKYEKDPDGDLPIEVTVLDRTRYERPYVLHVPYTHLGAKEDELQRLSFAAECYASMAKVYSERTDRTLLILRNTLREQVEREGTIRLNGQDYRPVVPEGLTDDRLTECMQKHLNNAWAAAMAPVDYSMRKSWLAAVAKKVSEELGVNVVAGNCVHFSGGVRCTFEVPAFDRTFRLSVGDK